MGFVPSMDFLNPSMINMGKAIFEGCTKEDLDNKIMKNNLKFNND